MSRLRSTTATAGAAKNAHPAPRQRKTTAATDGTTIDQVAVQLGVCKPFVYGYLHDRQQIFETLSWTRAAARSTVPDDGTLDALPAHEQAAIAIERLICATLQHQPAALVAYREPPARRAVYRAEQQQRAGRVIG